RGSADGTRRRAHCYGAPRVVGDCDYDDGRRQLRAGGDAGPGARLLAEPVAADTRRLLCALWWRRLPVLRRRPREAEDEATLRPVRVEGRLRPTGVEPGPGAARRT